MLFQLVPWAFGFLELDFGVVSPAAICQYTFRDRSSLGETREYIRDVAEYRLVRHDLSYWGPLMSMHLDFCRAKGIAPNGDVVVNATLLCKALQWV